MKKERLTKLCQKKWFKPFFDVRYALLAAACTFGIMIIVYFCYNLFPFGDTTILRMDLYHQYGPLFAELYEKVKNLDSLLYSWKSGGGGAFLGNFFNYCSSPTVLIMFILGHKNMPEAIAGMILVKAVTASFTFAYFISKKFNKVNPAVSAFGVLYACCGYFIAYYWNVMWLDAFCIFPLVMLGIEKLVAEGKMKLYLVTLAVTLMTNYYMGYMVCIFSVIYFLYTFLCTYSITDTIFGRLKKREKGFKKTVKWAVDNALNNLFINRGLRFALSSIGAGLLVAVSLLPVYYNLMNCSATSGTFPAEFKTYFSIFDFLANHLAYLNPTIRSSGTDVLPNVYCGMLPLILVPLYIFSNKIRAKEKVMSVAVLGIMFMSFYTNYLNYIWHGFHFPNDLPYRFSFMYSFLLLVLAFKALTFIREYTTRQIVAAGAGVVGFIVLVQEIGSKNFDETGVWISIAFVGIYCLALGMLTNKRYPAAAAAALILCSVCAEYTVSNTNNYSMDQKKSDYVSDYDSFVKIKDELDEYAGNDTYRMELSNLRARMDPCWYYYNGISTFSSMAYEKVANMHSHLGLFSNYINSYTYNRQTPVYNAFFALDYIVDNDSVPKAEMNKTIYKKLFTDGKFTAYENQYSLPIAFGVNEEMRNWSHDGDNPFEVQSGMFEAATGINDVYTDMKLEIVTGNGAESKYEAYGDSGCYPFSVTNSANSALTFRYTVEESGNGYLYFKTGGNNVKNITVTLPDGTVLSQNTDGRAYVLDLGQLNKGGEIAIYAPITEGSSGFMYCYPITLNTEEFKKGYAMLKKNSMNVLQFDDTYIKGEILADKNCVLFTSINYDSGWTVYVDGEKINSADVLKIGNALLGINLAEGKHTVEFKYMPEGLIMGAMISVSTLITLLLALVVIKSRMFVFEPELYVEGSVTENETAAKAEFDLGDAIQDIEFTEEKIETKPDSQESELNTEE